MSKTTIALRSLMASVVLAAPCLSANATTLTLSNWVPSTHYITTNVLQVWADKVEEATDSRVKVRMLPKPVGSPAQHWELARKGVVDLAWGNFTYEPDRFKSLWFAEMPFSGTDAEAQSVALWDTYQKYLSGTSTFNGVEMLGVGMLGGGVINHANKQVVTPADLENQKIRMGGPIQKRLLSDLGAVPIAAPATKAYELLESGVIDASLNPLESVVNFRIAEMLPHHTMIPGGFYDATFFFVMNEKKWKKLSEADREAIMSVSGEMFARLWGGEFDRENQAARAELEEAGHTFDAPSAELLEKIESVSDQMLKEWAAEGAEFEVEAPMEMVDYYRQRYQELAND
ncbi:TRAP transporter substrate-binding protein [Marinobacterium sp. YM272]|uniref:TRAP transporter substrate-binding protein n=1 Tax=Marinobacterium sp. YM272 TaxID=3421654 RepID=UPI003D7FB40D